MENIENLKFDKKNFNKHTEFGMSLLEKSLRQNGAGRSVLVDRDNNIIAGNGIVEAAVNAGITKTRVVEVTGDELVVVRRTDLELDSKQGREMALADNATAAADLAWDYEELQRAVDEFGLDAGAWGVVMDEAALYGEDFTLADGEKSNFETMSFTLAKEQADALRDALKSVGDASEEFGNTNRNGNKLYKIISQWEDARKSK